MKIKDAMVCINCDEIFDAFERYEASCPKCGSFVIVPLKRWIKPIDDEE